MYMQEQHHKKKNTSREVWDESDSDSGFPTEKEENRRKKHIHDGVEEEEQKNQCRDV